MTSIALAAYESVDSTGLTPAQARAFAATGAVSVAPGWSPGSWTISAGQYVGIVECAGAELRIKPRIHVARLLFLLGYTSNPHAWRDDPAGVDDQVDLWPAMAHVFVRQADRALRRGLLQGYRTEESAQLVLRGRLLEAEQLRRHAGIAVPLEVRFDEYDVDIAENRILRSATERMLRIPRLSPLTRGRLRHLRTRFLEVTPLVPGQPVPVTPTSRLNESYQPALALARMILRSRSVDILDAGVRATGFLVNMNNVFEDFITVALSEALLRRGGGQCVPQDASRSLDLAARIRIEPDLVYYGTGGIARAVIDAKYKAESPAGYPNADLYQMLSYCTALQLPIGYLLYAEGRAPVTHMIRNAGIQVVQRPINLSRDPKEILDDIDQLAAELTTGVRCA